MRSIEAQVQADKKGELVHQKEGLGVNNIQTVEKIIELAR